MESAARRNCNSVTKLSGRKTVCVKTCRFRLVRIDRSSQQFPRLFAIPAATIKARRGNSWLEGEENGAGLLERVRWVRIGQTAKGSGTEFDNENREKLRYANITLYRACYSNRAK